MHIIRGLLFVTLVSTPALGSEHPGDFDWTKFGQGVRAAMPKEVKAGTALGQAHHVAGQVADKLGALGIVPNYDDAGRKRAKARFQDLSLGTCGHTAQCVKEAWRGAGLAHSAMQTLVVIKKQPDGKVPNEINADHAAMAFLHPDGVIVFDLWCDGRTQKTFANFRASIWKGMPVGEWLRRMSQEGYTVASCQERPDLGEVATLRLPELLQKLRPQSQSTNASKATAGKKK